MMHQFVIPDPDSFVSGGNLYNRGLFSGLAALGQELQLLSIEQALQSPTSLGPMCWLDTLYLPNLFQLADAAPHTALGLLTHYLPSLVEYGEGMTEEDLSPSERIALSVCARFIAPSAYMAAQLERFGVRPTQIHIVRPGLETGSPVEPTRNQVQPEIMLAAPLISGKGVRPFLVALGAAVTSTDRFRLRVAGAADADPDYAADCLRQAKTPPLSGKLEFMGPLPHARYLSALRYSDLFVSASSMESFGLALAEARALGIPILARRGGNVAAHVSANWGGELVDDAEELAASLLALCRNPTQLLNRADRARSNATPPRSWRDAARDFLDQSTESRRQSGA